MPQLCHFWGVGSVAQPVAGTVSSSSGLFPTERNRKSADRLPGQQPRSALRFCPVLGAGSSCGCWLGWVPEELG